ncbi:hypothetical protein Pan189_20360 [Stratiformator vulcanicus]|uniref:HEPN domain-containing protein n=1 Tax=Stratiformator vulcanicus TaxID=2527980 RepID=A0A517R1B1_9PLAN|nr:hypothetical protein Pan189_20360 [Stratiformator vulcanicus]
MSLHHDLLEQANTLASCDVRRPKSANLRRAESAAYCALFHFLIEESCRGLIGSQPDRREYRNYFARGYQHSDMRRVCEIFRNRPKSQRTRPHIGDAIREISHIFVESQDRRHIADYDRNARLDRKSTFEMIGSIEAAIERFNRGDYSPDRSLFLAALATKRDWFDKAKKSGFA